MDNEQHSDVAEHQEQEKLNWALFAPLDKRPLKTQHPELGTIKEFEALTDREMRFVWLYACMGSPLIHLHDEKRLTLSVQVAFGKTSQVINIKRYMEGDFEDKIRVAVRRMSRFSPTLRMQGKQMVQIMLDNMKEMIKPLDKLDLDVMDSSERKQYVSMIKEARNELPKLIATLEEGFGIITLPERDKGDGKKVSANLADIVLGLELEN